MRTDMQYQPFQCHSTFLLVARSLVKGCTGSGALSITKLAASVP